MADIVSSPEVPEKTEIIGFVFALGIEAGAVVDRMKNARTTKGNGLIFHSGTLGGKSVILVESGIGRDNAKKATESLIEVFNPKKIISAGFAGGLDPQLKINEIIYPEKVKSNSDDFECIELSCQKIYDTNNNHCNGDKYTLITCDEVVETISAKETLYQTSGANLVDMETYEVASVCREKSVPFVSVRIIFDPADQELPSEVRRVSKPAQSTAKMIGSIVGSLFKRPSCVIDFLRLKENALISADILAKELENLCKTA
ncbi:MAG: hypothetical protein ACRC2T_20875 [Thermoguttaceae bacterium]